MIGDDDLLCMANEAGLTDPDLGDWMIDYGNSEGAIKKLARLLERAVLEKCAKVAADLYAQARADEIDRAILELGDGCEAEPEVYTPPPPTPAQLRIGEMQKSLLRMIVP